MKLKLKIENNNQEEIKATIFDVLSVNNKNLGLKEGIYIDVIDEKEIKINYQQFIKSIYVNPIIVEFIKSTNNKQLYFYWKDLYGCSGPIEPKLTIDRCERSWVVGEWNPNKWNIMDTHEMLIWKIGNYIELNIKSNQIFELEFNIVERKQINNLKLGL